MHVPLAMTRQHDQEHMTTDMGLGIDMDRPYMEPCRLAGTEACSTIERLLYA